MAGLDVHEIRSSLKLVHGDGESELYENRGGASCPVCGDVFSEVLQTTERTRSIRPSEPLDVCLVNQRDELFVFTHA